MTCPECNKPLIIVVTKRGKKTVVAIGHICNAAGIRKTLKNQLKK